MSTPETTTAATTTAEATTAETTAAATSGPQPKWEYMELTRKTEAFLVGEMNQLGAEGWELVSVVKHRGDKGLAESWSWTAFLKRPSTGLQVPKAVETLSARKELPVTSTGEAEIFDLQR